MRQTLACKTNSFKRFANTYLCILLKQEQNGRKIYHRINYKEMLEVADFIESFRKMWDERFNKLETIMKKYITKK
jgi:hypothetical protein